MSCWINVSFYQVWNISPMFCSWALYKITTYHFTLPELSCPSHCVLIRKNVGGSLLEHVLIQVLFLRLHSLRSNSSKLLSLLYFFFPDTVYREMMENLLTPLLTQPNRSLVRYSVYHCLPSSTNTFIGRAAHIAMLDSELFIEKLICTSAAKYFQ